MATFRRIVLHILLAAKVIGLTGVTGTAFTKALAAQARSFGVPLFLAGRLMPGNVRQSASEVFTYAVDVAPGVEIPPRARPSRVKQFNYEAKAASRPSSPLSFERKALPDKSGYFGDNDWLVPETLVVPLLER